MALVHKLFDTPSYVYLLKETVTFKSKRMKGFYLGAFMMGVYWRKFYVSMPHSNAAIYRDVGVYALSRS